MQPTVSPHLIYPTSQYYQAPPRAPPTHIMPANIELKATIENNHQIYEESTNSSFSSDEQDPDLPAIVDLDRIFEHRNTPPRRRPLPCKPGPQVCP